MCGSSDKPQAPDPYQTAQAQYTFNKKALQDSYKAGAINQYGPYGSTTYQKDASGMPVSQTVNLSPEVQSWLDNQFKLSGGLGSAAINQLSNLPTDKFSLDSIPSTDDIAKTAYQHEVGLMQPTHDRAINESNVNLTNRGIPVGSEIWNNENNRLDQAWNTALTGAAENAKLQAAQEYQRLFGNAVTARELPFQELASYMGKEPGYQSPNFQQTPWMAAQAPDYTSTVNNNYAQAMKDYTSEQEGLWSGLSGIGKALIGTKFWASDKNLKENRKPADGESILMVLRDMPVDDYDYKQEAQEKMGVPESRTGPMAQDVQEEWPEASDGHMIDIADVVGKLLSAVKALDARTADDKPKSSKSSKA